MHNRSSVVYACPVQRTNDAFHGRLGFGQRPGIVIVDMCKAYFTSGSPLFLGRPEVVEACRTLVEVARAEAHPLWWTRVEIPVDSTSVFRRKVAALSLFSPQNPLADWIPGLEPQPEEPVVTKQSASAFFGTDLHHQLSAMAVDTVVIAGVSTSGCVRATALDACQHNFVPIVVQDACGDRSEQTQTQNLADLDAKYADVVALHWVVDELRRIGAPR